MQPFSMVHNIIVYCVLILKKNKQWSAGEQKPSRHRRVGLCGQRGKLGPALSGADWGGGGWQLWTAPISFHKQTEHSWREVPH